MTITCWCNRCQENFDAELDLDWENQDYEPEPVCPQCGKTDRVSFNIEQEN